MNGCPPEPTGDACRAHEPVEWTDQHGNACSGFAIWYPQMGGYVGKAVVEPGSDADACFEVWVWHDGEFPFSEKIGGDGPHRSPAHLHHCGAEQFVQFGQEVAETIRKASRT